MRNILAIVVMLVSLGIGGFAEEITENCTYKGIPLYGKVKVVNSFADFKVQVVDYFPDLKVQKVDYFANSCGKWKFVDSFPDFTIQIVDYFPDFKIKMVDYFPGVN